MKPNAVRKPEQIKLIMECRQSGLSDYQWYHKFLLFGNFVLLPVLLSALVLKIPITV